MKKGSGTKTRISLTLDKELVETLNNLCKDKFMKVSPFVEYLIKTKLEEYRRGNKK